MDPLDAEVARTATDEEHQARWGSFVRFGGEALDLRNRRALQAFYALHSGRAHDFPGAFSAHLASHPIYVDGPEEEAYFHRAWDLLYATVMRIQRRKDEKAQEDAR